MSTKHNRPLIVLLTMMVAADARPGGPKVSLAKLKKMRAVLAHALPDLDDTARWTLVQRSMKGMPPLKDGIALMLMVEKQAQRLATQLDDDRREAMRVLHYLTSVARADHLVTEQEVRILQIVAGAFKLTEAVEVTADRTGDLNIALYKDAA